MLSPAPQVQHPMTAASSSRHSQTPWNGLTLSQIQIYGLQRAFKRRSWHKEHALAGLWLAAAWQDLISYVHEIWPNLHLLTLAPILATSQMNSGSQIHHYLFLRAGNHPSSGSWWSSWYQHTNSHLYLSDIHRESVLCKIKRKDHPCIRQMKNSCIFTEKISWPCVWVITAEFASPCFHIGVMEKTKVWVAHYEPTSPGSFLWGPRGLTPPWPNCLHDHFKRRNHNDELNPSEKTQ